MADRKKWIRDKRKEHENRFSFYIPQSDRMAHYLKKIYRFSHKIDDLMQGLWHDVDPENLWDKVLEFGLTFISGFLSTTDCHVNMNEIEWRKNGRPIIIIEDKEVAEFAYRSKLDIIPESLKVPEGIISFAFPKGVILDGIELRGCLFGEIDIQEHIQFVKDKVKSLTGTEPDWDWDPNYQPKSNKAIFIITMVDEPQMPGGISYLRLWFDKNDLSNIPNENWVEDNLKNEAWLKNKEYSQQRIYLKLCYSLCILLSNFEGCLRDGLPSGRMIDLPKVFKAQTLSLPRKYAERIGPQTHWRECCFRSLKHERFKRNPDGSVRVVFVRSTIVGGKSENVKTV